MSFNPREEAEPASAWRSSLFEQYAPCVLSSMTIDFMVTAVWLFNRDNHKHRVNLVAERGKELIPYNHLSVDRCLYIDNVLTMLASFLETPIWNFEAHCPLNRPWIRLSLVNFSMNHQILTGPVMMPLGPLSTVCLIWRAPNSHDLQIGSLKYQHLLENSFFSRCGQHNLDRSV